MRHSLVLTNKKIIGVLLMAFLLGGCSQFDTFKKSVFKFASQSQTEAPKKIISPSKVVRHKPLVQKRVRNNKCSYIVRDLSMPNATTVWCRPKHTR